MVRFCRVLLVSLSAFVFPAISSAIPFQTTIETNTQLHDGVAVYTYDGPNSYGVVVDTNVPADLAVGSHTFSSSADFSNAEAHYTYIGLYGNDDGISIGLDDQVASQAIANQSDITEVLGTIYSESDVMNYVKRVRSLDPIDAEEAVDQLSSFIRSVRQILPKLSNNLTADPGTMTKFSTAEFGGSISGQPVPEPMPLAALGLGMVAVMRRRK